MKLLTRRIPRPTLLSTVAALVLHGRADVLDCGCWTVSRRARGWWFAFGDGGVA